MPSRGQAGWKSKARKFAELLGSDDMIKSEVVPVETPTWSSLSGKPTNIATTDQLPTWSSLTGKPTDLATTSSVNSAISAATPTWYSLTGKPTNIATTDQLPTVPSNIVTHDGSGNVTLAGDLTANDVVIS